MDVEIVISGISGRFPECDNIDELRDSLFTNKDMITENGTRWPTGLLGLPSRGGHIRNIEKFDAQYFGIHSDQVNNMDPQIRILLELVFEAIVDSGE